MGNTPVGCPGAGVRGSPPPAISWKVLVALFVQETARHCQHQHSGLSPHWPGKGDSGPGPWSLSGLMTQITM